MSIPRVILMSYCVVCGASGAALVSESCRVGCNVRAFSLDTFAVWRCADCQSIHALDEVDLSHYYSGYPFFALPDDWRIRAIYSNQLRRLEKAGVRREDQILDYGCGSGAFVSYLVRRGYVNARGYDEYSETFRDRSVLDARYDCVLSQDVLEHVSDPRHLIAQLARIAKPGGVIAIGTPNAEAIDLTRAEHYRHALHLPYHRHILSKAALLEIGSAQGLLFERYYPTQYANTRWPFLNSRFYRFFMQRLDDTLDCLLDPPVLGPIFARLPQALFWGLFGSLLAEETDIMIVFRRSLVPGAPARFG
jgi:SAM-dependent methyltransferase